MSFTKISLLIALSFVTNACIQIDPDQLNYQLPSYLARFKNKYFQIEELKITVDPNKSDFNPIYRNLESGDSVKSGKAFFYFAMKTNSAVWSYDESSFNARLEVLMDEFKKNSEKTEGPKNILKQNLAFSFKTNVVELSNYYLPDLVTTHCLESTKGFSDNESSYFLEDFCGHFRDGQNMKMKNFPDLTDFLVMAAASGIKAKIKVIYNLQKKQIEAPDQQASDEIENRILRYRQNLDTQLQMAPQFQYDENKQRTGILVKLPLNSSLWIKDDVVFDNSFEIIGGGFYISENEIRVRIETKKDHHLGFSKLLRLLPFKFALMSIQEGRFDDADPTIAPIFQKIFELAFKPRKKQKEFKNE